MPFGIPPADLATVTLLVVLEGLLSADNAVIIAVMVAGLAKPAHRRALNYGLAGALTFRLAATILAVFFIRLAWLKLAGGLYLVYLCGAHFLGRLPVGSSLRQPSGKTNGSGFWGTVIRVELVNLACSVDSILVAVAMSTKLWVVIAGGLLGVVAVRVVAGSLVVLIRRTPRLIDGAFVIVGWISVKLLLDYAYQIAWIGWQVPQFVSLAIVVTILAASYTVVRTDWMNPIT